MSVEEEVSELLDILDSEEMIRAVARDLPERFSRTARDTVVTRIAAQFAPPPSGRILSRLLLIVTDELRPTLIEAYLGNLRSPDAGARAASLDGLTALGYPQAADLAKAALRDDDDAVVASAVRILAPLAADDALLRALLADVHATHRGDPDFYLTSTTLDAHRIAPREPQ